MIANSNSFDPARTYFERVGMGYSSVLSNLFSDSYTRGVDIIKKKAVGFFRMTSEKSLEDVVELMLGTGMAKCREEVDKILPLIVGRIFWSSGTWDLRIAERVTSDGEKFYHFEKDIAPGGGSWD